MRLLLLIAFTVSFASCLRSPQPAAANPDFSIRDYMLTQYLQNAGQPYSLYRIITIAGKTDTTIENFLTMELAPIAAPFFAADISDQKFTGQYSLSEYDDFYGNHVHDYTAKSQELFNQTTQVTTDPESGHVVRVYLQNSSGDRWKSHQQKLLYIPHSLLQIQDDVSATPGGARSLKVEYRFLQ